jgi:hypothetical protein
MAGFVNRKIEAVEPTVGVRRKQAKPAIYGQNYGEGGPPTPLALGIAQDGLQVFPSDKTVVCVRLSGSPAIPYWQA